MKSQMVRIARRTCTVLPALLGLVLVANGKQVLAQSCGCQVSDAKEAEYNQLLELDDNQKADAETVHLPWGVPKTTNPATTERILYQQDYIIGYDDDVRDPLWVAYRLTTADLTSKRKRKDCFRKDPRLSDDAASFCEDYDEPIFDRGHLAPTADMKRTEATMINTTILSNITPQQANFNQNIWEYLESYARAIARKKGELYIISGSVFDKDGDGAKDDDAVVDRVKPRERVGIPTHFYKILLYQRSNGFIETMTFMLPNTNKKITGHAKSDAYLTDHLATIDAVETITGIDFFSDLQDNKETAVERFNAEELWSSLPE